MWNAKGGRMNIWDGKEGWMKYEKLKGEQDEEYGVIKEDLMKNEE